MFMFVFHSGIIASKLFGVTGSKLQIWESKAFGNSNISFLPFIYDVLKSENIIPDNKESLQEIRSALDSLTEKRQKYETSEEVLFLSLLNCVFNSVIIKLCIDYYCYITLAGKSVTLLTLFYS